jgi:hypothetical protein
MVGTGGSRGHEPTSGKTLSRQGIVITEHGVAAGPTYGLIAVDRTTQDRIIKPSARWYGDVARTNRMPA